MEKKYIYYYLKTHFFFFGKKKHHYFKRRVMSHKWQNVSPPNHTVEYGIAHPPTCMIHGNEKDWYVDAIPIHLLQMYRQKVRQHPIPLLLEHNGTLAIVEVARKHAEQQLGLKSVNDVVKWMQEKCDWIAMTKLTEQITKKTLMCGIVTDFSNIDGLDPKYSPWIIKFQRWQNNSLAHKVKKSLYRQLSIGSITYPAQGHPVSSVCVEVSLTKEGARPNCFVVAKADLQSVVKSCFNVTMASAPAAASPPLESMSDDEIKEELRKRGVLDMVTTLASRGQRNWVSRAEHEKLTKKYESERDALRKQATERFLNDIKVAAAEAAAADQEEMLQAAQRLANTPELQSSALSFFPEVSQIVTMASKSRKRKGDSMPTEPKRSALASTGPNTDNFLNDLPPLFS